MKRISILSFLLWFAVIVSPPKQGDEIADLIAEWKAEYPNQWHLWGLNALDVEGDGDADLVLTQHYGGSRVLKQTDAGWDWANVGNTLGGTFRPVVFDANGDGLDDLVYRDSLPNTAYANTGGKFSNVGFGYGTDNDPIRDVTPTFIGNDWLRIGLPAFNWINYTNPNFAKLPSAVQADWWAEKTKWGKFCRGWFDESPDLVTFSIFYSYHKSTPVLRAYWPRRGKLLDVTAKLGLPSVGAVSHAQDFNGDGMPELLITFQGYYVSTPTGYVRMGGALSDFLAEWPDSNHRAVVVGNRLLVSNVRGQVVKVFAHAGAGAFNLVETIAPAWEEPFGIADFDGDGSTDIAVGVGGTIRFLWGPM